MSMADILRDCGFRGTLEETPILREVVLELRQNEARGGVPTERESRPRPFGRRRL